MGQAKEGAKKNAFLQRCKSYKRKDPPPESPKHKPIPPESPKKQKTLDAFDIWEGSRRRLYQ
jgi:hypothetical protein